MSKKFATVILTLNEELSIERAVRSVSSLGTVLVLDSGSSDGTRSTALAAGAKFEYRAWEGFASQRQAALEQLSDYEWVLFLDADETIDNEFRDWISQKLPDSNSNVNGFLVRRRNFFLDTPLMRAGRYPDFQLRLMKPRYSSFPPVSVHERPQIDGSVRIAPGHLLHNSAHSVEHFMAKHLEYARLEAAGIVASTNIPLKQVFGSRLDRRRWFKHQVWLRLPCRSFLRFWWLMIARGGVRDGLPALAYVRMLQAYENMIDVFVLASIQQSRVKPSVPVNEGCGKGNS